MNQEQRRIPLHSTPTAAVWVMHLLVTACVGRQQLDIRPFVYIGQTSHGTAVDISKESGKLAIWMPDDLRSGPVVFEDFGREPASRALCATMGPGHEFAVGGTEGDRGRIAFYSARLAGGRAQIERLAAVDVGVKISALHWDTTSSRLFVLDTAKNFIGVAAWTNSSRPDTATDVARVLDSRSGAPFLDADDQRSWKLFSSDSDVWVASATNLSNYILSENPWSWRDAPPLRDSLRFRRFQLTGNAGPHVRPSIHGPFKVFGPPNTAFYVSHPSSGQVVFQGVSGPSGLVEVTPPTPLETGVKYRILGNGPNFMAGAFVPVHAIGRRAHSGRLSFRKFSYPGFTHYVGSSDFALRFKVSRSDEGNSKIPCAVFLHIHLADPCALEPIVEQPNGTAVLSEVHGVVGPLAFDVFPRNIMKFRIGEPGHYQSVSLPIPNAPGLVGSKLYAQLVGLEEGQPPFLSEIHVLPIAASEEHAMTGLNVQQSLAPETCQEARHAWMSTCERPDSGVLESLLKKPQAIR